MKKKIAAIASIIIILAIVGYILFFQGKKESTTYTYGEVTQGNLNVTITSSGTLEALSTVDVGTQVSGTIAKLFVDFNSEVKKGQLLAILDTVNLSSQVREAKAGLIKSQAEYNQKNVINERNKKLFEKNFISELDLLQSQTDVESARGNLRSAEIALEKAKTNLGYAYIHAPISGKIINRSVEQGQTVAASLSAPTLFTIAEDLSSMRIMANVDESDIGQIKEGQHVSFTVQSYSDRTFEGEVTQIRLKSSVSSNVVNYTVVINAANKEKLLLPGMTATVDFYCDHRENVLLIPNTALRFEPSETMLSEIKKNMDKDIASLPDSIKNRFKKMPPPPFPGSTANGTKVSKENMTKIYYKDSNGNYKMGVAITGLTDGKNTEIISSRELKKGMKIIIGTQDNSSSNSTKKTTNSSPQNGPPPMMM